MLMQLNNRRHVTGFVLGCMFGMLIAISSTVSDAATLIDNPVYLDADPGTDIQGQLAIADNEQASLRSYAIQPSNLLEITVSQDSALNTIARVDANGDIEFPLIGLVKVRGATPEQLEQTIAALLEQDYIRNPQVTVLLKEYTKPKIHVTGSVVTPGTYVISGRTTLLESIALAGGPNEKADLSKIRYTKFITPSVAGQTPQPVVYNAQAIISGKQKDPDVGDGDIIHLEAVVPVAIEGAVMQPGLMYPAQSITLKQLVIMAGGVKPLADSTEISIYSMDAGGKKTETIYNLDEIAAGKAEDPIIQPGQIVVVDECASKFKLFNKTICSKKK